MTQTDTYTKVWQDCLDRLQLTITEEEYVKWFKPIRPIGFDGSNLRLRVPNESFVVNIEKLFLSRLKPIIMESADGTLTSNKGILQSEDGYWEIHLMESCRHTEKNEDGTSQVVDHSCKYSFIYVVHPDKQDFMIVRVKDKYEVYPLYVVMADSEEEALRLYRDYLSE